MDDDLIPEDAPSAFVYLESVFRTDFENSIDAPNSNYEYYAVVYVNKVYAAALELDVEEILEVKPTAIIRKFDHSEFEYFRRTVDAYIVRMSIRRSRSYRELSVGLSPIQKEKIHKLTARIRAEVDSSEASNEKKEAIFSILSKLALEVDQQRTKFGRFTDLMRGLVGISKETAEEGVAPWIKLMMQILGVVDDAKEAEPRLPKPEEIKRIEPPREIKNDDDVIPF